MRLRVRSSLVIAASILSGCVAMPPVDLTQRVRSDLAGVPDCAKMFLAVPVDCRSDRSLCVGGILSYQEDAQGVKNAIFAVAETEGNSVKACSWTSAGFARGWSYVENSALASCERARISHMSKTGELLKSCRVYARDNNIQ